MLSVEVFNQSQFEEKIKFNIFNDCDLIILCGPEFTLTGKFISQSIKGEIARNKPKLYIQGEPVFGRNIFIWSGYDISNVILTAHEKVEVFVDDPDQLSQLEIDVNKISVITSYEDSNSVDDKPADCRSGSEKRAYNQDELDEFITNELGTIYLHGELFCIPADCCGMKFIGAHENTIVLLNGSDDCVTARLNDENDSFKNVSQFDTFGMSCENVIVSSSKQTELVFPNRAEFAEWTNVRFDLEVIDIVIRENEYELFDIVSTEEIQSGRDFLNKYKAKLGALDVGTKNQPYSGCQLSYQEACDTYYKTKLKVGGVIRAKMKAGYSNYGVFAGKDRIISIDRLEERVVLLNHDEFLKGTGFFNGSAVYRMGVSGNPRKSLEDCYEVAISKLGSHYTDDYEFVKDCRFLEDEDFELEDMESAMAFLDDL